MITYVKSHEEHATTPLTISPPHHAWPSKILKNLLGGREVGKGTFCIHQDRGLTFYADYKAWDEGSDYLLNKIKSDSRLVRKVRVESEKIVGVILCTIRKFEYQNASTWPNKKIANFLEVTYKLSNDLSAYGFIPVFSDHFFHKFTHLLKDIVKGYSKGTVVTLPVPEIIHIVTSYTKFIPSKLARIAFLKLVLKVKGNKLTQTEENKFKEYYYRWFWVSFGQFGPRMQLNEVISGALNLIKNKSRAKKELVNLLNYPKETKKKQVELEKKLGLTGAQKRLFKVARDFMYLKGLRMEVLFGVDAAWEKILEEISKRFYLKKEFLYYASIWELSSMLRGGKALDEKMLRERSRYCVWLAISENKHRVYTGREARTFLKSLKYKDEKINEILVIHGTVASLGYAKGKVKIVNKTSEICKVENGDILVSVATHPGLVPAMKKAIAFITDSGGITSHAAIVAREMKKPCIIGTKVATKVLKDGDMVEIDTKKGDVRKV